jgi:hypothetical protein
MDEKTQNPALQKVVEAITGINSQNGRCWRNMLLNKTCSIFSREKEFIFV